MKDKSLHVKLVIVSLLEHNLNQRISHFCSFDSTRKVNIDESFVADTLWSAHILKKTPICWESTMQNDPLSL